MKLIRIIFNQQLFYGGSTMKRTHLLIGILAVVFSLSISSFGWAQDSTRTKLKNKVNDKTQTKEQLKTQKKEQKQLQNPEEVKNQIQHGYRFVDENGDGYNDNAPDHDGDGIPNGIDPDYTGPKNQIGKGTKTFIDENGDGINDNIQAGKSGKGGKGNGRKSGYGPGDGTGNKGVGPQDGSGNGPKTGGCDGTGPKGKGKAGKGGK